jgi:hypothetical protein
MLASTKVKPRDAALGARCSEVNPTILRPRLKGGEKCGSWSIIRWIVK